MRLWGWSGGVLSMVDELGGGKEDLVVERWGVMVAGFQARDSPEAAARRSCDHRIGDEERKMPENWDGCVVCSWG